MPYSKKLSELKVKHEPLHAGRGSVGKTAVVGLRERGGRTIAYPVANTDKECLQGAVLDNVEVGTQLMTDESTIPLFNRGIV